MFGRAHFGKLGKTGACDLMHRFTSGVRHKMKMQGGVAHSVKLWADNNSVIRFLAGGCCGDKPAVNLRLMGIVFATASKHR
jgi:hypothetical protein